MIYLHDREVLQTLQLQVFLYIHTYVTYLYVCIVVLIRILVDFSGFRRQILPHCQLLCLENNSLYTSQHHTQISCLPCMNDILLIPKFVVITPPVSFLFSHSCKLIHIRSSHYIAECTPCSVKSQPDMIYPDMVSCFNWVKFRYQFVY